MNNKEKDEYFARYMLGVVNWRWCLSMWIKISIAFFILAHISGWILIQYMQYTDVITVKLVTAGVCFAGCVVMSLFTRIYFSGVVFEQLWPWVKWRRMSRDAQKSLFQLGLFVFLFFAAMLEMMLAAIVL